MLNIEKLNLYSGKSGFISKVYYSEEIDSTNAYAKSFENETDLMVISDFQTRGLGRMERKWESEKGKNLTFTIKKHFSIKPENIQAVNFYFSYFLLAYVKDFILKNKKINIPYPEIFIKWPNDIYINNDKIAGILIESSLNGGTIESTVVGIGLNINQEIFTTGIPNPVSLHLLTGKIYEPATCLSDLSKDLDRFYKKLIARNMEELKIQYMAQLYLRNKWSRFRDSSGTFTGRILTLSDSGMINIERKNGELNNYGFKEVEFIP